MPEDFPFLREDVFPSWFANRFQDFLSAARTDLRLSVKNNTTIQIVPKTQLGVAAVCIEGRWRFITGSIERAHPGGGAGTYIVWAVATDNDVDEVPKPHTDHTDYSFDLRITAGENPSGAGVEIFTQIGEISWNGAAITALAQNHSSVTGPMIQLGALSGGDLTWSRNQNGSQKAEINENAITAVELADNSVDTNALVALAVTEAKIAAQAVTNSKIGLSAVGAENINNLAVTTAKLAALAVTEEKLGGEAVTEAKIKALAVTAAKLAAEAVETGKLKNLAVTAAKLAAEAVETEKLKALAVTEGKIAAEAVTSGKLGLSAVTAAKINNLAVETTKLAAAAVIEEKIGNEAVTTAKIKLLAITSALLAAEAVETGNIKNLAVTAGKLAAEAVGTGQLANLAVTTEKLAAEAVETGKLKNLAVTAAKLAALAVEEAKIADGAVSSRKFKPTSGTVSLAGASVINSEAVTELGKLELTPSVASKVLLIADVILEVKTGGIFAISFKVGATTHAWQKESITAAGDTRSIHRTQWSFNLPANETTTIFLVMKRVGGAGEVVVKTLEEWQSRYSYLMVAA